ncbi:hypothetical protein [Halanaerocella petrolearia]
MRKLKALQHNEVTGEVLPANWTDGE